MHRLHVVVLWLINQRLESSMVVIDEQWVVFVGPSHLLGEALPVARIHHRSQFMPEYDSDVKDRDDTPGSLTSADFENPDPQTPATDIFADVGCDFKMPRRSSSLTQ
jgi:hypothetical protein